jgi:F-type H+-transporting ATPase subunit delta
VERRAEDGLLEELRSLVEGVFEAEPRLEIMLASPAVGRDRKAALLQAAFAGRASETFLNFLNVLNDHDRLDLLRSVHKEYERLLDRRKRRVHVQVRTAVPLPQDQRDRLAATVSDLLKVEPILEEQVDPSLLGGIVVRVGNWMFDASVRNTLQDIRHQLITRGSHELQSRRDHFGLDEGDRPVPVEA